MSVQIRTSAISGLDASPVFVEAQVREGKRNFTIIGLGDNAVREARDRVASALSRSGFRMPEVVLVNLAPGAMRKEGTGFDLPIALSILAASGQIPAPSPRAAFVGELSLGGLLRPVRGVVAHAIEAFESGLSELIVPYQSYAEASLISEVSTVPVANLAALVRYLGSGELNAPPPATAPSLSQTPVQKTLDDVWGQENAKRALEIAAAGGHNLLMIGPPGCGKSMLAERFGSLLPPLTRKEMLEVIRVHSVVGLPLDALLTGARPFRAPHHIISEVGLVGGGVALRPGEISLAHQGVLFLDELPEYRRFVIEGLRAPLESGAVSIARAKGTLKFPARFQLIAAMNPCPCGRLGTEREICRCPASTLLHYRQKISQPILDRIDLHVSLRPVSSRVMAESTARTSSPGLAQRLQGSVAAARSRQLQRQGRLNSTLGGSELGSFFKIRPEALTVLERAAKSLGISARGYVRALRVGATIADLAGVNLIESTHVAEALGFRSALEPCK